MKDLLSNSESPATRLIQIGRPSERHSPSKTGAPLGPIADKFFLAGAVAMVIGGAGIGAHLWLMLRGAITMPSTYLWWKALHGEIQLVLFFGLFITGFLLQAGPRLFEVRSVTGRKFLLVIPATYLGVFGSILFDFGGVERILITAAYLAATSLVANIVRQAPARLRPSGALAMISLSTFAIAPYVNLQSPLSGLVIFWGGVASASLVASQQFIAAFLGGRSLHGFPALHLGYVISFATLIAAAESLLSIEVAAVALIATIALQIWGSRLWVASSRIFSEPLVFGVVTAHFWAMVGAISLFLNPALIDRALHIWTLGWGSVLVFGVSSHIMQHLSSFTAVRPRILMSALWLWQAVIVGRCFDTSSLDPRLSSRLLNFFATVVLGVWIYGLVRCEIRILGLGTRSGDRAS